MTNGRIPAALLCATEVSVTSHNSPLGLLFQRKAAHHGPVHLVDLASLGDYCESVMITAVQYCKHSMLCLRKTKYRAFQPRAEDINELYVNL